MSATPAGRFAPSPTGDLHLGNLRTALLAWLFARSTGRRFLIRIEDLDRERAGSADGQLADLAALGLDWDGPVVYQTDRTKKYDAALAALDAAGLTYECFCSRKDIAEAASAPQTSAPPEPSPPEPGPPEPAPQTSAPHRADAPLPPRAYPGTCRNLTEAQRARKRSEGKSAAIRLRAGAASYQVTDLLAGDYTGAVDDVVLRRRDGTIAYNLAVVVDDADQGIDQVVRGDDLLSSTPRQAYLAQLLGLPTPTYAHVPLVLGPAGRRLAKRDGAVTIADLAERGITPAQVLTLLGVSLNLAEPGEPVTTAQLLDRFDPAVLPRGPWRISVTDSSLIPLMFAG